MRIDGEIQFPKNRKIGKDHICCHLRKKTPGKQQQNIDLPTPSDSDSTVCFVAKFNPFVTWTLKPKATMAVERFELFL